MQNINQQCSENILKMFCGRFCKNVLQRSRGHAQNVPRRSLAGSGGTWWTLAAALWRLPRPWRLLAAPGDLWRPLAGPRGPRRPLAALGGSLAPLVAPGGSLATPWLLLAAPGGPWRSFQWKPKATVPNSERHHTQTLLYTTMKLCQYRFIAISISIFI